MRAVAQDDFVPSVDASQLSEDLTLLKVNHRQGGWVNSLLLRTSEGGLLVDHAGDWRTLEASPALIATVHNAVDEAGALPIRYFINTHWHGDHTAGNTLFEDIDIIAHENVKTRLSERQTPFWFEDGIGPMDPSGWPNHTFTDSLTLIFDNERVLLWNFGLAHSDGDAVVYFERADVVHMGDLYHGLNDISVGDDMRGIARTLAETLTRITIETRVVTGHGGMSSYEDLTTYNRMLLEAIAHVEGQINDEASMEEILVSGLPDDWSGRLSSELVSAWYREIYRSLTGR